MTPSATKNLVLVGVLLALAVAAIAIGVSLSHSRGAFGSSSLLSPPQLDGSDRPSVVPSMGPTTTTRAPTLAPSDLPSGAPSRPPIDPEYGFHIKMQWQPGYRWQNETLEREWCLECVRCDPLSTTEFGLQDGCFDVKINVPDCFLNDQLWLQQCDLGRGNAEFQLIPGESEEAGDQLRVKDSDLCVERMEEDIIMFLGWCNASVPGQRWLGFDMDAPFQWQPLGLPDRCVSQHHHPKKAEVLYAETCYLACKYHTCLWEAVGL